MAILWRLSVVVAWFTENERRYGSVVLKANAVLAFLFFILETVFGYRFTMDFPELTFHGNENLLIVFSSVAFIFSVGNAFTESLRDLHVGTSIQFIIQVIALVAFSGTKLQESKSMLQISAFENLGEEFHAYHLTYFLAIYQECSDDDHRLSCAFKNDEQPCFTDEDLFGEFVELLSRNIALKMMLPSIMMLVSWFSIKLISRAIANTDVITTQGDSEVVIEL